MFDTIYIVAGTKKAMASKVVSGIKKCHNKSNFTQIVIDTGSLNIVFSETIYFNRHENSFKMTARVGWRMFYV